MPKKITVAKSKIKIIADDYFAHDSHGLNYLEKKYGYSSSWLERTLKDNGYKLRPTGWNGFREGENNPSSAPERRKQISLANKGKTIPPKVRRKISSTMKKRLKEPELHAKWVKSATGRKFTDETKAKIAYTRSLRPKTTKYLKAQLDTTFAKYIRLRDSLDVGEYRVGNCCTCNKPVTIGGRTGGHAGHFMSRRHLGTRYDEKNVNLQCAGCNMWGAGQQYMYSLFLEAKYGKGTSDMLHAKAHSYQKFTDFDYEQLIKMYKEKLKKLK